jgi:DNA repair and recombination protein RAD54B
LSTAFRLSSDLDLFLDEYVVFVTPTALQLTIFAKILNPDKLDTLIQSSTAESLALINMLTKISNSPILLKATADKAKSQANEGENIIKRTGVEEALKLLPARAEVEDVSLSGAFFLRPKNLCLLTRYRTRETHCNLKSPPTYT